MGLNSKSSDVGNYFVYVINIVFELPDSSFILSEFRDLFLLAVSQVFS